MNHGGGQMTEFQQDCGSKLSGSSRIRRRCVRQQSISLVLCRLPVARLTVVGCRFSDGCLSVVRVINNIDKMADANAAAAAAAAAAAYAC